MKNIDVAKDIQRNGNAGVNARMVFPVFTLPQNNFCYAKCAGYRAVLVWNRKPCQWHGGADYP